MGKFLVVPTEESFTQSTCTCEFCLETHQAVRAWERYKKTPTKTNLQKRMISVVKRIEKRHKHNTRSKKHR